jgi:VanZ family protein
LNNEKNYKFSIFKPGLISLLFILSCLAFTPLQSYLSINTDYDKMNHLLAFLILAIVNDYMFSNKSFFYYTFLPLMAYAVLIETVQYFLPSRSFSLFDIIADMSGILVYLLILRKFMPTFTAR